MKVRWLPALVVLLVAVLAGCGDGDAASDGGAAVDSPFGAPVPAEDVVAYADVLVERHGGPEAFARTWWALDRGYSVEQLTQHAAALEPDGTVSSVDAAGPPLRLLTAPPVALAAPTSGTVVLVGPAQYDGDTEAQQQYVEFAARSLFEVYMTGTGHALDQPDIQEPAELAPDEQARMTLISAALLGRGYSPEQVVEALLFGMFRLDRVGTSVCYSIPDEAAARAVDVYADSCGPLDAVEQADGSSTPTDDVTGAAGTAPVDAVWEGEFSATGAAPDVETNEISGTITIERLRDGTFRVSGAGSFTMFLEDCQTTFSRSYEAVGSRQDTGNVAGQIAVTGTVVEFIDGSTCGGYPNGRTEQELGMTMTVVDGTTIEGFRPFPFSLTGPEVFPEE